MSRDKQGRFFRHSITADDIGACILIVLSIAIALLA